MSSNLIWRPTIWCEDCGCPVHVPIEGGEVSHRCAPAWLSMFHGVHDILEHTWTFDPHPGDRADEPVAPTE